MSETTTVEAIECPGCGGQNGVHGIGCPELARKMNEGFLGDCFTSTAAFPSTLRDWFAGMALQGMLAQPLGHDENWHHVMCAETAYKFADAMLAERSKG